MGRIRQDYVSRIGAIEVIDWIIGDIKDAKNVLPVRSETAKILRELLATAKSARTRVADLDGVKSAT